MTPRNLGKLASSVLALFMLGLNPALSQSSGGLHSRFYYLGTIGPSLDVQFELVLENTRASGDYFYEHVGAPLYLTGSRPSHYDVVLEEHDAGVVTGRLTGTLSSTATSSATPSKVPGRAETASAACRSASPRSRSMRRCLPTRICSRSRISIRSFWTNL
jgi:hypothetical protein